MQLRPLRHPDPRRHRHDTGLIYMRAREYDPQPGEFVTVDPLEAITGLPTITPTTTRSTAMTQVAYERQEASERGLSD